MIILLTVEWKSGGMELIYTLYRDVLQWDAGVELVKLACDTTMECEGGDDQ